MTKVCFVSLFAYPLFNSDIKQTYGGSEVQMYRLAIETAKSPRFTVTFLTGDFGQPETETVENVRLIKAIPPVYKNRADHFLLPYYYIKFWLKLLSTQAEYIVERSAGSVTFMTAVFCLLAGKKLVYMAASTADCNGKFVEKNGLMGKLFVWSIKRAHLIIVQTDDQQKMLKDNYSLDSTVLKNSISIPGPNGNSRHFITWISRLDRAKNPELFIQLARDFPRENFVMIAPTAQDPGYQDKIAKQTEGLKNLLYIPGTSYSETQKYLTKSRFLVHTSDFEGFPNTFIEAAIYGVPVISLHVNPDEFINRYKCGLFAGGDVNLIGNFIKHVSQKEWHTMSENIYNYGRENHDLETNSAKFRELLLN